MHLLKSYGFVQFLVIALLAIPTESSAKRVPLSGICSDITEFRGMAVFCHSDDFSGAELMISDGSARGNRIIKDIAPGKPSSNPITPTVWRDHLYFITRDYDERRVALWKSDGTESGTIKLIDTPAVSDSRTKYLGRTDDAIFFLVGNSQIITSGGTPGTTKQEDFPLNQFLDRRYDAYTVKGNKLYLVMWASRNQGNATLYSVSLTEDFTPVLQFPEIRYDGWVAGWRIAKSNFKDSITIRIDYRNDESPDGISINIVGQTVFTANVNTGTIVGEVSLNDFTYLGAYGDKIGLADREPASNGGLYNVYLYDGISIDDIETIGSVDFAPQGGGLLNGNISILEVLQWYSSGIRGIVHVYDNESSRFRELPLRHPAINLSNRRIFGLSLNACARFSGCLVSTNAKGAETRVVHELGTGNVQRLDINAQTKDGIFFVKALQPSRDELWFTEDVPNSAKMLYKRPNFGKINIKGVVNEKLYYEVPTTRTDLNFKEQVWLADATTSQAFQLFYSYPIAGTEALKLLLLDD